MVEKSTGIERLGDNMDMKKMLKEFSNKAGVSGMESEIAQYSAEILSAYGKIHLSPLGNVICTVKEPKENEPNLMLVAHMDEIGMIITHIDEKGFVKIGSVGGVDRNTLTAEHVVIHGTRPIQGVICSTPPHLQKGDKEALPKIEDIYIDTGYTKEELEQMVCLGDRVTVDCKAQDLLGEFVTGKAMDDRCACVCFLRVCELLEKEDYHCGLSVVFSTMEEIGGQGAITAAGFVKPSHAIVVDVSSAYTPDMGSKLCGKMKKGPMIGYAPILDKKMSDDFVKVAKAKEIPYQYEIMSGRTGTDADSVVVWNTGVKTSVISIPIKYMHTKIETIAVSDVENTAKLIAEYIKTI